jgi:hypothetical protein
MSPRRLFIACGAFMQFRPRLILAIGLMTMPLSAQTLPTTQPAPPVYTVLRWNEDYSYLKNPSNRTDFFDPIKYVPLNSEGDWYLSLGGQGRYRYELFDNFQWGFGQQDGNGYSLFRLMGHVDVHMGENLRAFVQIKSSLEDGRDPGPRAGLDEDDFDFEQAFADLILPIGDARLTLRGGRQNLLYGAQRLISPLDWSNDRRTFDGGKGSLAWPNGANTLDLFWVQPVTVDDSSLNGSDDNQNFFGAYDVLAMPDFIRNGKSKLDFYALGLKKHSATFEAGTGEEDRGTVGARFFSVPKPWDVDIEGAYQFGDFANGNISAWMVAIEGGYTIADAPMTPRLSIGFDVASGDDDLDDDVLGTFNQLYPLGHAYFGYIDAIGRQNIIDLHPGLKFQVSRQVNFSIDYHLFWRYSGEDAVYNASGAIVRSDLSDTGADLTDARFIGSEIDLLLNWQIDRHFASYIGYSHFFAGAFIDDTAPAYDGADEDIDFFYVAATYTF